MKAKNIFLLFLVGLLIFTSNSCNKDEFLDQTYPDRISLNSYWRNEQDIFSALMNAYTNLTWYDWQFGEQTLCPMVYRGDDVHLLSGAADWSYLNDIGIFNYDNTSSVGTDFWSRAYTALNAANFVIYGTSIATSVDEGIRKKYEAEAKFLRAIMHMQLLINYDRVIMVDSYNTGMDGLNRPITPKEQIWNLVEEDLTFAAQYLPANWDDENKGRATQGAAFAFLGKAHLYQKEYQQAHDEFVKVEGLGYALVDDYESLFTGNENSEESIFEIQFSIDQNGGLWWQAAIAVSIANSDLGGWNMFRPSDKLINTFKAEPDINGNYDKRLVGSIVWDDPASTFLGQPTRINTPSFKKYINSQLSISNGNGDENFYFMRYADVLLMDAEALTELNQAANALPLLKQVRDRANLAEFTDTNQDNVRQEIRKQRFLEFACEGLRFNDLVRWGIATEVLHSCGIPGKDNYNEAKHAYFQVPKAEVDANPNVD